VSRTLLLDPEVVGPTRAIAALTRGNRLKIALRTIVTVVEGVSESIALLLLGNLALGVATGDEVLPIPLSGGLSPTSTVLTYVLLLVLLRFCLGMLSARLSSRIASSVSLGARTQMIAAYGDANYLARQRSDLGELMQRVSLWPLALGASVGTLLGYLSNVVITSSMLVVAFLRDPLVSLFVILLTVALFALFVPLRRYIRRLSAALLTRQETTARSLDEFHHLGAEAEAFGVLSELQDRVSAAFADESMTWRQTNFVKGAVSPTYVAVSLSAIAVGLGLLSLQSPEAVTSLGPTLLVVLRSLSYGQGLQQASTTLASFTPMLHRVAATQRDLKCARRTLGQVNATPFQSLRLRGVTFTYQTERTGGLDNISLEINRGDRLGVVGPSGGGKSTLAKVLLGLIEPLDGDVLLNGRAVSDFSSSSRTQRFAYVPQFARLMSGSLEDNTVFFRRPLRGTTVDESIMASGLLPDEHAFPEGLATQVDPHSAQLSGGQVQRLAVARALLGRPEVLVLDEPTSSVGAVSEVHIRETLRGLGDDVTLIIVSHRPELLELCNKIAVLEDGCLSCFGTRADVIRDSIFARGMLQ
jgi:ATP-binding cassette subfamily B protein